MNPREMMPQAHSERWEELVPELRLLADCPQDPIHHAEGDVAIHTQMVIAELESDPEFGRLPVPEQRLLWLAALLHDVGKPKTTKEEEGRITSRGHSRQGELISRRRLWEAGLDFQSRELICMLIRHHQLPLAVAQTDDLKRKLIIASARLPVRMLARLSLADARGRRCQDPKALLTSIEMFSDYAKELDCWDREYPFPSPLSRYEYATSKTIEHPYPVHEGHRCRATVVCGLPGSGKDSWLRANRPGLARVSLDEIRRRLRIGPTHHQGRVLAAAHEEAKQLCRAGQDFCWNATLVTRQQRQETVSFLEALGARVELVYLEVPPRLLFKQNREREAAVPESVLEKLISKWEVPTQDEAPQVSYQIRELEARAL